MSMRTKLREMLLWDLVDGKELFPVGGTFSEDEPIAPSKTPLRTPPESPKSDEVAMKINFSSSDAIPTGFQSRLSTAQSWTSFYDRPIRRIIQDPEKQFDAQLKWRDKHNRAFGFIQGALRASAHTKSLSVEIEQYSSDVVAA